MLRSNVWLIISLFVGGLALSGCTEGVEDAQPAPTSSTCAAGAKCDGFDRVELLSELSLLNRENIEGEEETLQVYGEVADDFYFDVEDGHVLKIEIWASDGASDPDFVVEGELVYDLDHVGAFLSDSIDVSELLPYQGLRILVTGEYGENQVVQLFEFLYGATDGTLVVQEDEEEEPAEADPFEDAHNVDLAVIYIDEEFEAPAYRSAATYGSFVLSGTEFWQKWEDGLNPTYNYYDGTNAGRKCMYASAVRFDAIMADAPEALVELVESTKWSGRFFNWNDDFSPENSYQNPRGAALWAWRTSLIKWISQTGKDGACYLPTRDVVQRAAENCLRTGESNDGEIQDCQAG
ncbi:MAG: hypothetical protein ACNA8W_01925 [Bradymonadaceae bacterium]